MDGVGQVGVRRLPTHEGCRILDLVDELLPQRLVNLGLLDLRGILTSQLLRVELLFVRFGKLGLELVVFFDDLIGEVRLELVKLYLLRFDDLSLHPLLVLTVSLRLLQDLLPQLCLVAHVALDLLLVDSLLFLQRQLRFLVAQHLILLKLLSLLDIHGLGFLEELFEIFRRLLAKLEALKLLLFELLLLLRDALDFFILKALLELFVLPRLLLSLGLHLAHHAELPFAVLALSIALLLP